MSEEIEYLIKCCEVYCVKDCCGLNAFDFSPVHIASYLLDSGYSTSNIEKLKESLSRFIEINITSIENNLVYIHIISDSLNKEELKNLQSEISANIDIALKIIEASEKDRYKPETSDLYEARINSQLQRNKLRWINKLSEGSRSLLSEQTN